MDGRPTAAKFGTGRSAGTGDDNVGFHEPRRNVGEEGREFGGRPLRGVGALNTRKIFVAALLDNVQTASQLCREQGDGLRHDVAEHAGAERAAQNQKVQWCRQEACSLVQPLPLLPFGPDCL